MRISEMTRIVSVDHQCCTPQGHLDIDPMEDVIAHRGNRAMSAPWTWMHIRQGRYFEYDVLC